MRSEKAFEFQIKCYEVTARNVSSYEYTIVCQANKEA